MCRDGGREWQGGMSGGGGHMARGEGAWQGGIHGRGVCVVGGA